MQLYTFQARSLAEALRLVRDELGPDASVLHTREVGSPLLRLLGSRAIEVTASAEVAAPSRLPAANPTHADRMPAAELQDFRRKFRHDLFASGEAEPSLVEQLATAKNAAGRGRFPGSGAIADRLKAAGVSRETADRWLQRLEAELVCDPECHPDRLLERLKQIIATDLAELLLS
jgi:flagellar biosynthesis protein FlhF